MSLMRLTAQATFLAIVLTVSIVQFAATSVAENPADNTTSNFDERLKSLETKLTALESENIKLKERVTTAENNAATLAAANARLEFQAGQGGDAQRIAFIDPIVAFESDQWYIDETDKLKKEIAEARNKKKEELEPKFKKLKDGLSLYTVGEEKWRECQREILDFQLNQLEQFRQLEADFQEKGDAILFKVYGRMRAAIEKICKDKG
ncbi:MAG: OmpH family outer membrane protein, partial [Planctomycetes bacterium]|nr:OmpH family outer membrane protein [Planctomycetota bacterium]